MRNFKFYKEETGRWYVDLPEWEGEKAELEMVMGADSFLEILSQGENEVYVTLSDKEFETAEKLELIDLGRIEGVELGSGAWYSLKEYLNIPYDMEMWLCDVTKFVFGDFPKVIYFK